MTIAELTGFTKSGGPLTKRISLTPDGSMKSDSSACIMARGTAQRVRIADVGELARVIGNMRSDQAIALGAPGRRRGCGRRQWIIYRRRRSGRPTRINKQILSRRNLSRRSWRRRVTYVR
jgi:hypothetical protein